MLIIRLYVSSCKALLALLELKAERVHLAFVLQTFLTLCMFVLQSFVDNLFFKILLFEFLFV